MSIAERELARQREILGVSGEREARLWRDMTRQERAHVLECAGRPGSLARRDFESLGEARGPVRRQIRRVLAWAEELADRGAVAG